MSDLSVTLGGVKLRSPIIVAAGPLTSKVKRIKKAEECGAGAVSVKHIFHEQPFQGRPRYWLDPQLGIIVCSDKRLDLDEGIQLISEAKAQTNIPVIANMSGPGTNAEGWGEVAQKLAEAGADMIEINLNCPNLGLSANVKLAEDVMLGANIGQVPELAKAVTEHVRAAVDIPVIVKLTSEGGKLLAVAKGCSEAGADALNVRATFQAAPGIDIYDGGKPLVTGLNGKVSFGGLTGRWSRLISNRFISQTVQTVPTPIIGGGGIFQWEHVVEKIMYGSTAVQMCTALILNGVETVRRMLEKLDAYLESQGYSDLSAIRGAALKYLTTAPKLEFVPVVAHVNADLCNGCTRCTVIGSCDAIAMVERKAVINRDECVGCSLCSWVCPKKAINMVRI